MTETRHLCTDACHATCHHCYASSPGPPLFASQCDLSTPSTVAPDIPCLLAILSGDHSLSPDKHPSQHLLLWTSRGRQPIIYQYYKQTRGTKTDTTSLLIKLIINPLSATPPLAIEPVSSVIVLPIDPEPEELVGDGIFLQINGDDVFLEEFADGGIDNAGGG